MGPPFLLCFSGLEILRGVETPPFPGGRGWAATPSLQWGDAAQLRELAHLFASSPVPSRRSLLTVFHSNDFLAVFFEWNALQFSCKSGLVLGASGQTFPRLQQPSCLFFSTGCFCCKIEVKNFECYSSQLEGHNLDWINQRRLLGITGSDCILGWKEKAF